MKADAIGEFNSARTSAAPGQNDAVSEGPAGRSLMGAGGCESCCYTLQPVWVFRHPGAVTSGGTEVCTKHRRNACVESRTLQANTFAQDTMPTSFNSWKVVQ